ncbi:MULTISPECIES: ATP-binding protein [unclassified Haematospirillum]|uniref:sensor histidine kinase n=1 Tax=unclassified Haematospirillum TaxID=2622088 RepID=UPI001439614C|nr:MULTISPECIES: ATP-binding protein [unclassified Haematospirillum]NKD54054.1 PAS domain S-box protein [Haematospirillum sp. H4890]NKD74099.1 PAS domain S-box protein [Haematospirillum sp. H4485]NKD87231.1 PAS domain S-box protein [Haematospirillum sp. 15-248]
MMDLDDAIDFLPEPAGTGVAADGLIPLPAETDPAMQDAWKVLVVDDDVEVHHITRIIFSDFSFRSRPVRMLSAYSARQAVSLLEQNRDVALMLLDVVMETENSGLELVSHVRDIMKLDAMRIVLRTGQPGQAPERDVVMRYDINDYKSKTELTAQKLLTLTISALRAYEAIEALENSRRVLADSNVALEQMVEERTRALSASEAHYRAVLDAVPEGVLVTDDQGTILSASPVASAIFRSSSLVHNGLSLKDLVAPPHSTDVLRTLAECRAGRVMPQQWTEAREVTGQRPDGSVFPMDLSISRMEHQGTLEFVATVRDVTQRHQYQETLRQARLDAEQAARAKSDFLAVMSHEIRTPLNGILGMAQILRDDLDDEHLKELSDLILRSGESLLKVLNDILDFSKLESGHFDLETVRFVPRDMIRDVMALMAGAAAERDISLSWDAEGPVDLPVFGDPSRLRQVLLNLLSNALKFTEKGYVCLHAEAAVVPAEEEHADDDYGSMLLDLRVVDSGIGIPDEQIDRLFEHFSQADSSISRRFGGTGLGLAICRKIVGAMNGRITVHSQEGQGSSFTVRVMLPCAPTEDSNPDRVEGADGRSHTLDYTILDHLDRALGSEQVDALLDIFLDDVRALCGGASTRNGTLSVADLQLTARRMGCQKLAELLVAGGPDGVVLRQALDETLGALALRGKQRSDLSPLTHM